MESDNVSVHRAAANKLSIETRATRGSVCNALLSGVQIAVGSACDSEYVASGFVRLNTVNQPGF